MTTKNILILSIILAEILFLGYTNTYELPPLSTEEMKTAVTSSVQRNAIEAERISCNPDCEAEEGTITIIVTGKSSIVYCGMEESKIL